jgi:hypothetical protein
MRRVAFGGMDAANPALPVSMASEATHIDDVVSIREQYRVRALS